MTIHTVQSGDTIYGLARQYGVPPSRILTDNLLDTPGKLTVGENLVILYPTVTHTVKGGETAESISRMHQTNLLDLYRNNAILGGTGRIYPGQTLNIAYAEPQYGEIEVNGYAYPSIDERTLRRTLPYLTYLSIFSYGIREDGTLIPPPGGDETLISLAREYRTLPLLVLTSLTEEGTFSSARAERILSGEDILETVIQNVVATVKQKNYGGVDVDFEYIPGSRSTDYANFVRRLKEALGEGYPVFVSLAPKYSGDQEGLLYEGHDYASLGAAADRVLLMTYEWGYTYGPPLPVSPIREVRRVIDYAVTEIPREKILMGIPNYGYDWTMPYIRGESRAESLGNVEAVARAGEKNAEIRYDNSAQAPYYRYYDRGADGNPVEHIVWFNNANSAKALVSLVNEYGLAGIGVWNINTYFPALWLVVNQLYGIKKLG